MRGTLLTVLAMLQLGVAQRLPGIQSGRPRILNGEDALPSEFPFMVLVETSDGWICGGSLLSLRTVVTAAHCLQSKGVQYLPSQVTVTVGDHNRNLPEFTEIQVGVERVISHPEYGYFFANDIALVVLETSLDLLNPAASFFYNPLLLPDLSGDELYAEGASVTVTGWGETEVEDTATILQKLVTPVASTDDCLEYWKQEANMELDFLSTDGWVCTGKPPTTAHAYFGDSGGPLVVGNVDGTHTLVGIVSFGPGRPEPEMYVVNTKVLHYLDWIKSNLEGEGEETWLQLVGGDKEGVVVENTGSGSGLICGDQIGLAEVGAICRTLGFSQGTRIFPDDVIRRRNSPASQLITTLSIDTVAVMCPEEAGDYFKDCDRKPVSSFLPPCFKGEELAVRCFNRQWVHSIVMFTVKTKYREGGSTVRGKTSCSVQFLKNDESVDIKTDLDFYLIYLRGNGQVQVVDASVRPKVKSNSFKTKFESSVTTEKQLSGCLACFVSVKGMSDKPELRAYKIQSGCRFETERVEEWVDSWAKSGDRKPTREPL
ncbi:hypothetical protein ACHWQZ_G004311 [Mnemiopsis leidyi]